MFERICEIISEQFGVSQDSLKMSTPITDLTNDSLDIVELLFAFEEEFDIKELEDGELEFGELTIADIVTFIKERLN